MANIVQASARRIMSLQEPTSKMSKSHADPRSRILINDSPGMIEEKIRLALTDSIDGVSYNPLTRPGVSNLITLLEHLDPGCRSPEELAKVYHTLRMKDFKQLVTDVISSNLIDIRTRYNRLLYDTNLEDALIKGTSDARRKAIETIHRVKVAVGLY